MMLWRISLLSLTTLVWGCQDSGNDSLKKEKDALAAEKQALQAQLLEEQRRNTEAETQIQSLTGSSSGSNGSLQNQIEFLRSEIASKEAALAEQQAEIEGLRSTGTSPDRVVELEKSVLEKQAILNEQKLLVARLEIAAGEKTEDLALLYKQTMTPYAGVWLLDPAPDLAFEGCQYMIRFDAEGGNIYRVAICSDGKMQAEVQNVSGFSAKNDAGWSGTLGFNIDGTSALSSCGEGPSYFPTGTSYGFDHSLGTATSASEASLFMSSQIGESLKNFKSGSQIPDLGKNKNCGSIVTRSKLESQVNNTLLQTAAKVCLLTPDLSQAGCFTDNSTFIPPAQ